MTDDPMDAIEMRQALTNMAGLVRHFHIQLVAEGFTELEALKLATTWLAEIVRNGKRDAE